MPVRFYNTLSRKKEIFKPRKGKKVQLFVCGPTVYDHTHIGHARTYVAYDALVKYLRLQKYNVFYLQNITDIDDKIINRAKEGKTTPKALANKFTKEYFKDMKALKIDAVDKYAKATDYIPQIISQVESLRKKGIAYKAEDGFYFDLSKFKNYGKLAGRTALEAEDSVSRIDNSVGKRSRGDFALWKFSKTGEPIWKSGLGNGRPGWHIEDTAITGAEFGPQYDVHGGARDLIFPHHEAEIAQMEALSGKSPLVKYWIHTGFLTTQSKKMSKSLGNFITIKEALKRSTPEELRFFFLSVHYKNPIDYSEANIRKSKLGLKKLNDLYNESILSKTTSTELKKLVNKHSKKFYKQLEDDFNTPQALATLFDLMHSVNKLGESGKSLNIFLQEVDSVFGVFTEEKLKIPKRVTDLVKKREAARLREDWKEADQIRKTLKKEGFLMEDTPKGPKVKAIK